MSRDSKSTKIRHSSLDMPDVEVVKKKHDMLTKARTKLFHLVDHKGKVAGLADAKKSGKLSAIESLFKASQQPIEGLIDNAAAHPGKLLKQNSVTGYPIRIEVEEYDDCTISRNRPATICVDKIDQHLQTEALALERPQKKLSFREPEMLVSSSSKTLNKGGRNRKADATTLTLPTGGMKRSVSFTNGMIRNPGADDVNLESQAMRVVRTIGQAFEVCHKLSITAPENIEYDEQETLTQDLLSDRVSDVFSDKSKRDFQSEPDTDRISLPDCDNSSLKELQENKTSRPTKLRQLESLPPPPSSSNNASSLISAETYSSPHSDLLTTDSSVATHSLPSSGSALSAHHEMQLLREQLDQQSQQTQAAMAQLQLAREQLAAEQTARMEAQSRTHQLLVHNRELLDHIAALVSHLQGGSEKSGLAGTHQQNAANLTLPQTRASSAPETYMSDMSELLMDKGSYQDLIENRMVTSCLPPSPLNVLSPTGGMFNFQYPPEASYESQLLQNMQPLGGYNPNPYHFNFNPVMPYFSSPYYPPPNMLNKSYTLPHPSHKFASAPINARHSYMENQIHVPRPSSEPRQATHQYHSNTNLHFTQPANSIHLQNYSQPFQESFKEKQQNPHSLSNQLTSPTLTQNAKDSPLRGASPRPSSLIKPLPQVGTITTTDADGKVRVIVPVPSSTTNKINNKNDAEGLLANLKLTDDFRMNGPPIQRSTSEKVPNRSELLSQVQRAMWARHTTK